MLEYIKCNLCGSGDFKIKYKSNLKHPDTADLRHFSCTNINLARHGQIVVCNACGLVYTNPRLSSEQIYKSYQDVVDPVYVAQKNARLITFSNSLKAIEKLKCKGKILDVGCYAGFFLEVARNSGWEVYGVEPSIWASEFARSKPNLNVKTSGLQEAGFAEKSFDVITFWDTLEHLSDPLGTLKESARILKDDGLLCISTINIGSLPAKILNGKWPQLMQMHTYYYTPATLNKLLGKSGFTIIKKQLHWRVLGLDYLLSRFENYSYFITSILRKACHRLGLSNMPLTVIFGDLIDIYAQKTSLIPR